MKKIYRRLYGGGGGGGGGGGVGGWGGGGARFIFRDFEVLSLH